MTGSCGGKAAGVTLSVADAAYVMPPSAILPNFRTIHAAGLVTAFDEPCRGWYKIPLQFE